MSEIPLAPPGYTAVLVFNDKTPNTIILKRIVEHSFSLLQYADLNPEEANDFIELILLIARKMLSVWNHLGAYHQEVARLREKFAADPTMQRVHSQELFEEFDVFVVQIKSTLDHLVKVMRPMLGRKWTMYTWADKGIGVLNSLQRNTSKHYAGRVRMMEHFVFSEKNMEWVAAVVDTRDKANHCLAGGLRIQDFAMVRLGNGSIGAPLWTPEQELGTAMDIMWENFFMMVEDFINIALYFRFKVDTWSLMRDHHPLSSQASSWKVVTKEYADSMIEKHNAKPL